MKTTRRQFLSSSAAVAAAMTIVPRRVLGGAKFVPPSDTVNVALVGAGGLGRVNLQALFQQPDVRVVAVADPAESFSLEDYYYKGQGGRTAVKAQIGGAPKAPG